MRLCNFFKLNVHMAGPKSKERLFAHPYVFQIEGHLLKEHKYFYICWDTGKVDGVLDGNLALRRVFTNEAFSNGTRSIR